MNASPFRVCLFMLALLPLTAGAQIVIPATPKGFTKRGTSSTTTNGGSISLGPGSPSSSSPAKVRYVMHVALSESRQWQSSDGRSLLGSLIAFEDVVAETEKGAPAPPFTRPAIVTVVKDNKARLLVDKKPYELPLDRLSQADRDFVEKVRDQMSRKAAAPAPK